MNHGLFAFKRNITLEIVTDFDEPNDMIVDSVRESFKKGEIFEATLIPAGNGYVDIQFGDGSLALGVFESSFSPVKVSVKKKKKS